MSEAYYPVDDDSDAGRTRTSVRLPNEEHERVKFMAALWNALDKANGKTGKKWAANSVIERLVSVGLDSFGAQIGGWPSSPEERAAMIAGASKILPKLKK